MNVRAEKISPARASVRKPRVVVFGAGLGGIAMGHRLVTAGIMDFTIYEKSAAVGGTWQANTYPGVHCDVPSHHYCYTFAPNPEFSSLFSPGAEIRQYIENTAKTFGIFDHIVFNTSVVDAQWDGALWQITLSDGSKDAADILVSATGVLRVPKIPDIKGLDSFAGPKFHTTRWDHSIDYSDKRIGVIGNGSTSVQIVVEMADRVSHLMLFQRTAQWVYKAENMAYTEEQKEEFRRNPQLLAELYEQARAGMSAFSAAISGEDQVARAAYVQALKDNLATVRDPALRAKLTPDYEAGCKRQVVSPGFYEAIQKPTVSLVTEAIDHIAPNGIVTADGELHEFDVLVLATGFDAQKYIQPITMTGKEGHTLAELWSPRPIAFHSITIPHMPNFFMIGGPYSPVGNVGLFMVGEWNADYILKCIDHIADNGVAISPTAEATAALMDHYREGAKSTIWASGCSSWYLDRDGVPHIYPFSPEVYSEEALADPDFAEFEVTALAGD